MRFPGHRNPKHYFPVSRHRGRITASANQASPPSWYLLGLDEVLVDIEVTGSRELAPELGLVPGESVQISAEDHERLLARLQDEGLSFRCAAGGSVANTLNNFTYLSGERSVLLGAIQGSITPGDFGYSYVAETPKAMDLSHLIPVDGPTGTALTFIAPDGERSFGVAPGVAGDYPPEAIPEDVVQNAAVVLTCLYCLRPMDRPIASAALRLMEIASKAGVPVAFGLGTASLVREMREQVREILAEYVTIAAMNADEAEALTGESDALLAARSLLDLVDIAIITEGAHGLTIGGWTDERVRRRTRELIRSKSIREYNRWEYSRLASRADCEQPLRVYSHIHPYRGGPDVLSNTSGAGDAALAALLHDIAANRYHRDRVPASKKHESPIEFLTYSSLSRNAQYGNRTAYEVLKARSPRLDGPVGPDERDY